MATSRDLNINYRYLFATMAKLQFGRIENLNVRGGQPVFHAGVRIVRSVRLGGEHDGQDVVGPPEDFELKRPALDLVAELERLQNGIVVRLEFRHGLPCLLEVVEKEVESPR